MTRNTSTIASSNVTMTFSIEIFTNGAVSNGTEYLIPAGMVCASSAMRARTAAAVCTALAPGDSMMAAPDAACPFSRMLKLKLCAPSDTFATSPMVTFEPSAFARSTMAANSAGVCSWPCTVSGMVTRWPSTAGESPRRPGAICAFCCAMAAVSSPMAMLYDTSLAGSTQMRMARSEPNSCTLPTPGMRRSSSVTLRAR